MENEPFQPNLYDIIEEPPTEKPEEPDKLEVPEEPQKSVERNPYDELVKSVEHTIISKHRLEEAIKKYYDNTQVKEVGALHVSRMTSKPSGFEFFVWVTASPEVAKISGADIVLESLSEHQQEICQRIIAPEKFLEPLNDSTPPLIKHRRPSTPEKNSKDDDDDRRPWVPGKGYVN